MPDSERHAADGDGFFGADFVTAEAGDTSRIVDAYSMSTVSGVERKDLGRADAYAGPTADT
ncbi:MAG: hypothetical protein N3A02_02285, partial [Rectinema sp.]|nr:hypothetical protein [Rectinema sp.]